LGRVAYQTLVKTYPILQSLARQDKKTISGSEIPGIVNQMING
jgi:hypothetical protein